MEYASQNKESQVLQERQPDLVAALARLKYQNDLTEDITTSIKEKLKSVLKWEQPPSPENPANKEELINSAIDEFNYQLRRKEKINDRLSDCLLHLKQII